MGSSHSRETRDESSFNIPEYTETSAYYISPTALTIPFGNIKALHNDAFQITVDDFIDHIEFLREAIDFIDVLQDEETLAFYVDDYCQKITDGVFLDEYRQQHLAWPLLWLWHVHRLHPIAYNRDCIHQLPREQLLDPKGIYISDSPHMSRKKRFFSPSIDLVAASIDQIPFLEKFKEHPLYACNLQMLNLPVFEMMVENYMSFLKLAKHKQPIVPTFDISLIWHTHLRYPRHYRCITTALCGYVLDHDDFSDEETLETAYESTKDLCQSIDDPESFERSIKTRRRPKYSADFSLYSMWPLGAKGSIERSTCVGIYTRKDEEEEEERNKRSIGIEPKSRLFTRC